MACCGANVQRSSQPWYGRGQDPRQPQAGPGPSPPRLSFRAPRLFPAVRKPPTTISQELRGQGCLAQNSCTACRSMTHGVPVGSHQPPLSSVPRRETVSATGRYDIGRPQWTRETIHPGQLYVEFPLSAIELLGALFFPEAFWPLPGLIRPHQGPQPSPNSIGTSSCSQARDPQAASASCLGFKTMWEPALPFSSHSPLPGSAQIST